VCAIYRDEAPYLSEWIEFHRLVGAERFVLYDNQSRDDHRDVLAPYVQQGIAVVHDWPHFPGQISAYSHCIEHHRRESRWIAFIDLDEFLFSPTDSDLAGVLKGYEPYPAVAVNAAVFGHSGHRTKPPGLVLESYLRRGNDRDVRRSRFVKSIVDPERAVEAVDPHRFVYTNGSAVDENRRPVHESVTESVSFSRLRVNHYYTRSEAEFRDKLAKQRATGPYRLRHNLSVFFERLNAVPDDAITSYLPALREALRGAQVAKERQEQATAEEGLEPPARGS
jgi:hypothetical protein